MNKTKYLLLTGIALIFTTFPLSAQENRGFLIQKTFHTGDNTANPLEQRGRAAVTPALNPNQPSTIGFWIRRKQDNNVVAGVTPRTGALLSMDADGTVGGTRSGIPDSLLPNDDDWHYFTMVFYGQGDVDVYRDGVNVSLGNGAFADFLGIGSNISVTASGVIFRKVETKFTSILDDVSIWNGNGADILQIHLDIAKYGMKAFPSTHPDRLFYFNFDSSGEAMEFWEDDTLAFDRSYFTRKGTHVVDDTLIEVTEKPVGQVVVTINSEFGAERVSPKVSESGDFDFQENQETPTNFSAPEFVYLDRYRNELDPTLENIRDKAFYRAKNIGYTVEGGDVDVPGDFSFQELLQTDITVTWQWDLEYAVIVDSATDGIDGLEGALGDPRINDSGSGPGKYWFPADTAVEITIDGRILAAETGEAPTARFDSTGYIVENAPDSLGRYFSVRPGLSVSVLGIDNQFNLPAGDFTVEFWMKRDSADEGTVSAAVSFGLNAEAWFGFTADNRVIFQNVGVGDANQHVPASFSDFEWHHWAWVYDSVSNQLSAYRDAKLVRQTTVEDARIAGFNVIYFGGTNSESGSNITRPFHGEIDNFRMWDSTRTVSELRDSMSTREIGAAPDLLYDETFDGMAEDFLDSLPTNGYSPGFSNDDIFPSDISLEDRVPALFPEFNFVPSDSLTRMSSGQILVQDWVRLLWRWEKRFKVTVNTVSNTEDANSSDFEDFPYVTIVDGDPFDPDDPWVPTGSDLIVGAQFRDCLFTLDPDRIQATGAFAGIEAADLEDGTTPGGLVSRQFSFASIQEAAEITWPYNRTRFQAILPLGEGLDVSSTANANIQLIPDLCPGTELAVRRDGPGDPISDNPREQGGTRSLQWDFVGEQLLPLQPGTFQVNWPDASDPDRGYVIEIVAGFPEEESVNIPHGFLDENGNRTGTFPNYETEVTFDSVSDAFPASPTAHYRQLASANNPIPSLVDPNPGDRWHFVSKPFSQRVVEAVIEQESGKLTMSGEGKTVLLYNVHPDPGGVAVGNSAKEAFAVRIVESFDIDDEIIDSETLSTDNKTVATFDATDHPYMEIPGGAGVWEFRDNVARTYEFWCRLDPSTENPDDDRIIYEQSSNPNNDDVILQIGFRGPNHTVNPSGLFFEVSDDGGLDFSRDFIEIETDNDWHHWAIIMNPTGDSLAEEFTLYHDGVVIAEFTEDIIDGDAQYSLHNIGGSPVEPFGPLGEIDNFRVWTKTLNVDEVRASMLNKTPADPDSDLEYNAHFDEPPVGSNFPQSGANANSLVAPSGTTAADFLTTSADGPSEVATRITSKLDTAGFGSGYLLNAISNYNAAIYSRDAEVGTWGPIYPVNWSGIFEDDFVVAYYENPFLADPQGLVADHPNISWPYIAVDYDTIDYPSLGVHKDKRIYIASRLGTEGVDANGDDQLDFDPASYEQLSIYNQPDIEAAGYNPNEEHALVAPGIKDQLTGDSTFNLGQDAAFALQKDLNLTDRSEDGDDDTDPIYTSDPWVLVQYFNLETDEFEMAAYKVEATRDGSELFPAIDATTHLPTDSFGVPVTQPTDPTYDFDYPIFAGDILTAPYPLNLVVGSVTMSQNGGGQIQGPSGINQRTLWRDINENHWVVAGEDQDGNPGRFFFLNWYPFRGDFWFDTDNDGATDIGIGTPIVWLPKADGSGDFEFLDESTAEPVIVRYRSFWRDDYPVLKRGETVTYQGGEFAAENFDAEGLPAILAWASGQVIFDSMWPLMVFDDRDSGDDINVLDKFSARLIRPLDRIEADFEQADLEALELTPAFSDNVLVVSERWYFKALVGSLQKRFYFDSLRGKLVFRGRVNDLESGDPDLTVVPISLSILEPNVMTFTEFEAVEALGNGNASWGDAIESIFLQSQDPHSTGLDVDNTIQKFYAGVQPKTDALVDQPIFFSYDTEEDTVSELDLASVIEISEFEDQYQHLNSLGIGTALVPNPKLLTAASTGPLYVTLAENNHPDAGGAITLHIIEISEERFRGAIKVVEAQDVFDEKINLRHTGDFGGNTEDVYYQWWIHEVASLDGLSLPGLDPSDPDFDAGWQLYDQGLGLHQIEFTGNPVVALSDQLFYVRYGEKNELEDITGNDPENGTVEDASWRLVDINDTTDTWERLSEDPVPFQWAGASNSPQLQADGSKEYIPQLVMGWVKRVLDRINPYEARFTDFINNDSGATYSSMLQIVGTPFIGRVALNSDKDVIENVGLIELYETVLARAKDLTLEISGNATPGTNQALLLAATRLAVLYDILAREAYNDAQDPTINVTDENGLSSVASYVHAFQNLEPTLLHEELALLRGTDFLKAFPAFNRLFWNYVKGLGEAAYNANYNIYDFNEDGFINEFDAARLYPQGHGDAWGHFLSANNMHYELVRDPAFDWESRAELYSLLDNVIEADYLDEKSFAHIAAAKARAGEQIVKATYRQAYVEDPEGQWQGYTDANQARAWGVSEWAKRTGQAALFDWFTGNALVSEDADETAGSEVENLDQIDREVNRAELSEIAAALLSIQTTLDQANNGYNPLGLDQDAIVFDIEPLRLDGGRSGRDTHFEQVYDRAVQAAQNAVTALDLASRMKSRLRSIADDTLALQVQALEQDASFRNRLIEIFGRPYDGTIGVGQVYPEGYEGPDTLLYQYIDRDKFTLSGEDPEGDDLVPSRSVRFVEIFEGISRFSSDFDKLDFPGIEQRNSGPDLAKFQKNISDIFDAYYLTGEGIEDVLVEINAPISTTDYAFQALPEWGERLAYGKIQSLLNELLEQEIKLRESIGDYETFSQIIDVSVQQLRDELVTANVIQNAEDGITTIKAITNAGLAVLNSIEATLDQSEEAAEEIAEAAAEGIPTSVGLSTDVGAPIRGGILGVGAGSSIAFNVTQAAANAAGNVLERTLDSTEAALELRISRAEQLQEIKGIIAELSIALTDDTGIRIQIAGEVQRMHQKANEIQTAIAEGFRLLDEREAFNKILASKAQKNRYQDMIFRLSLTDALSKYQNAYENAQRYAWLAAKAYDYETGLSDGHPAAATSIREEIIKTRALGLWEDGEPAMGQGGLAEVLARLNDNFQVLKGQLGINNPQFETGRISLRHELMRISTGNNAGNQRWQQALQARRVANLWDVPEFRLYCRPFASPADGDQPGFVIPFRTEINVGKNVFGRKLGDEDHAYSAANYATKIRSVGLWFEDYENGALATTPRVYLVPAGADLLRISTADFPTTRVWNVVEQQIPVPFVINQANLTDPNFIPSLNSLNGSFAKIRRFGDFRAYPVTGAVVDLDQLSTDSRLIGRSVANTQWLLIIPGAHLHGDADTGLDEFVDNVSDIKLLFETYSHQGI